MTERPAWTRDVPTTAEELLDMMQRPAWWSRAACLGVGVELFFPARGEDASPALAYCARCSVTQECAAWSESFPGRPDGVWGGLSGRGWRARRSELGRECGECGARFTKAEVGSWRYCSDACRKAARFKAQRRSNDRRRVVK